jgi:hypothetical protein
LESELDIKKQCEEMFKRIEAGGMFHCQKCGEDYPIAFKVVDICRGCSDTPKPIAEKKKTESEEVDEILYDFKDRASGEEN